MPNKNTPPKHKTPNYKLITTLYDKEVVNGKVREIHLAEWIALPLRSTRKDLAVTT